MRPVRVAIAAGGTAGHVFPGLAVAGRLRQRFDARVLFVGSGDGQEARLVPEEGFRLATIPARPFARRLSPATFAAPIVALRAAGRCRRLVRGADVVLSMGGYASVPVSLAAGLERVPLVIHEQNAVPGLANRLAARWARAVALSFDETARGFPARSRTVVTGNPVRERILRVPEERDELAALGRRELDLDPRRRTVVVFGGSQGALHLDEATVAAVRRLSHREDLQLLLITGAAHHDRVVRELPATDHLVVRTRPFVERMELIYAVADLVVSRAGATTIAELTVCGVPSLLVPYPYATARHQEANARALQRAGAASLLLDEQVSGATLSERIEELLHAERLRAMRERASALGKPDAVDALADLVAEAS